MNLESQIQEFQTQTYPTVEQTIQNNASLLYKRKRFFLEEFRQSINVIGFAVILLVYIRDQSSIRFFIRAFLQYSISNPFPLSTARLELTEETKKLHVKHLLISVILFNIICTLLHLIFGVYSESGTADGYFHGSLSIQFIGERLPYNRLELLIYDGIIFFTQLVYHNLMCLTDDSKVLETHHHQEGRNENLDTESDGYNGDVQLISIDLIPMIRKALEFSGRYNYLPTNDLNRSLSTPTFPGSFV